MDVDELVWLGGLRVQEITQFPDAFRTKSEAGWVVLSPDNAMTGSVKWTLSEPLLKRMRIGTRIRLAIDAEYFAEES